MGVFDLPGVFTLPLECLDALLVRKVSRGDLAGLFHLEQLGHQGLRLGRVLLLQKGPVQLLQPADLVVQPHQPRMVGQVLAVPLRHLAERRMPRLQRPPVLGQFLRLAGVVGLPHQRALQRRRQLIGLPLVLDQDGLGLRRLGLRLDLIRTPILRAQFVVRGRARGPAGSAHLVLGI